MGWVGGVWGGWEKERLIFRETRSLTRSFSSEDAAPVKVEVEVEEGAAEAKKQKKKKKKKGKKKKKK